MQFEVLGALLQSVGLSIKKTKPKKNLLNFDCFPIQLNSNSISSGQVYNLTSASQAF